MLFTASLRTTGLPFSTELRRETFRARDVCFKSVFYRCMCAWDNWPVQCISQFYGKLSQEIIKCIRIRISGNESTAHNIVFRARSVFGSFRETLARFVFLLFSNCSFFCCQCRETKGGKIGKLLTVATINRTNQHNQGYIYSR